MKAAFPILARRVQGAHSRWDQPAGGHLRADEKPPGDTGAEDGPGIWTVRGFLLLQSAVFLVMVSIHFGLVVDGYRHQNAGATELLLVAVLVAGLLLTWIPRWSRRAATVAQSFGTVGVLLGLLTIALGIGPRSVLDLALNGALLLTLTAGIAMTRRKP